VKEVAGRAEDGGGHVPPKRPVNFNGLHGVISQKIELFIATALRTSNPIRRVHIYTILPISQMTVNSDKEPG
jgi:hypothetical protein